MELKKNEFQGELEKQREQLDRIQSSHDSQLESVNKIYQDEKARPALFPLNCVQVPVETLLSSFGWSMSGGRVSVWGGGTGLLIRSFCLNCSLCWALRPRLIYARKFVPLNPLRLFYPSSTPAPLATTRLLSGDPLVLFLFLNSTCP